MIPNQPPKCTPHQTQKDPQRIPSETTTSPIMNPTKRPIIKPPTYLPLDRTNGPPIEPPINQLPPQPLGWTPKLIFTAFCSVVIQLKKLPSNGDFIHS